MLLHNMMNVHEADECSQALRMADAKAAYDAELESTAATAA